MTQDDDALPSDEEVESAFRIYINQPRGRRKRHDGLVVKNGKRVTKIVELLHYAGSDNSETISRTLRFRSFSRKLNGPPPEFGNEAAEKGSWYVENDEIEKLLAFLENDVPRTGRYRLINVYSPHASLMDMLDSNDVDAQTLVDVLTANGQTQKLVDLIASTDLGLVAAQSAIVQQRRQLIRRFRQLIDNSSTTEPQIQHLIGDAYWIFGGRYVGVAARRNLIELDQHDIPLLGADGTLHIIELKRPGTDKLIYRHRNHWIVGPPVHEATAQAMNYLRGLDEVGLLNQQRFKNELGVSYDMSRVFATVVIGHSDHHRPPEAERDVVARTIRQYNSHMSRVEVITYDQLVDAAERALMFEEQQRTSAERESLPSPDAPTSDDNFEPWDDADDEWQWTDDSSF